MPSPSYEGYFQELALQNPESVCQRAGCEYDPDQQSFRLVMWGRDYIIHPGTSRIHREGKNALDVENPNYLLIIQYLLNARDIGIKNEWISEKDIPGGTTFFRGPHEIPTHMISNRFANDLKEFKSCCEQLGGTPTGMGDAGYRFRMLPRIPVALTYWIGDEDFPAEARILFDRTITRHLATDIVFLMAVSVCRRVGRYNA